MIPARYGLVSRPPGEESKPTSSDKQTRVLQSVKFKAELASLELKGAEWGVLYTGDLDTPHNAVILWLGIRTKSTHLKGRIIQTALESVKVKIKFSSRDEQSDLINIREAFPSTTLPPDNRIDRFHLGYDKDVPLWDTSLEKVGDVQGHLHRRLIWTLKRRQHSNPPNLSNPSNLSSPSNPSDLSYPVNPPRQRRKVRRDHINAFVILEHDCTPIDISVDLEVGEPVEGRLQDLARWTIPVVSQHYISVLSPPEASFEDLADVIANLKDPKWMMEMEEQPLWPREEGVRLEHQNLVWGMKKDDI